MHLSIEYYYFNLSNHVNPDSYPKITITNTTSKLSGDYLKRPPSTRTQVQYHGISFECSHIGHFVLISIIHKNTEIFDIFHYPEFSTPDLNILATSDGTISFPFGADVKSQDRFRWFLPNDKTIPLF